MRKPDRIDQNETPGELACTFKVWIEPSDLSWEDIVDPTVEEDKTMPEGTEVWDVAVECEYESETFTFSGVDSLGGIIICGDSSYIEECVEEVKAEAYGAMLEDIKMIASGANVKRAELEREVALAVKVPG